MQYTCSMLIFRPIGAQGDSSTTNQYDARKVKPKHSEPRYIMPIASPLFLLAGIGLSWVLKERKPLPRRVGPAVLTATMVYTFLPFRGRVKGSFMDRSV
jgi:hypothetical protein